MTKSLMPCAEYIFMMCHRIGLPPISIIGLGLRHGLLGDPRAETAGEDDCFQFLLP